MCLNCGCMRAHDDMGMPGVNITYEDVKRAAEANADDRRRDLGDDHSDQRQGSRRPPDRVPALSPRRDRWVVHHHRARALVVRWEIRLSGIGLSAARAASPRRRTGG